MKNIVFAILSGILIIGCAPYEEVKDVIYLQNANVNSPVMQIPVFLSTSDTTNIFVVRPRVFIGNEGKYRSTIPGHSKVNAYGIFQVDSVNNGDNYYYKETPGVNSYPYDKENYFLATSSYNIGIDFDLYLAKSFCLTGGVNFSNIEQKNLVNWRAGFGLRTFKSSFGFRVDAGLSGQEVQYDVQSVIIRTQTEWFGDTETIAIFTRDRGTQNNLGYYFNLGLTYDPEFYIGAFINGGYFLQKFLDIIPYEYDDSYTFFTGTYTQTDMRNEISSGFLNLSTGLLFNVQQDIKLIGGIKYLSETNDNNLINPTVYPFVQLHFGI